MKKIALLATCVLVALCTRAEVSDTTSHTFSTSDIAYGVYGGLGLISPTGGIADNFKGCAAFHLGATVNYQEFSLKTDVQFGQPDYKHDNFFNAPAKKFDGDEKAYETQMNDNSNPSLVGWSIQAGYKVLEKDKFSITPNVGLFYNHIGFNVRDLDWKQRPDGIVELNSMTVKGYSVGSWGVMASVDFEYCLNSKVTNTPFLGNGKKRFMSYIRVTPFIAYAKHDYSKYNPVNWDKSIFKGGYVGLNVSYVGLLKNLY